MKVIINEADFERSTKKESGLIKEMIVELGEACRSILSNPVEANVYKNFAYGRVMCEFYEEEAKQVLYFFKKRARKEFLNIVILIKHSGRKILYCSYEDDNILLIIKPILIKYGEALKIDSLIINKVEF